MGSVQWRGLYAVADTAYLDDARLLPAVTQALRGGAHVVQYRDKSIDTDVRNRQARALRELCAAHGAHFIVNDDIELARAVEAGGVHLGRHDPALGAARRVLGANAIIGVSCYNDLDRAEWAVRNGASYVAFGSFFPSRTKPDTIRADPALLRTAKARFSVPLVAIGGITPENGGALIEAGADALAVISGLFAEADVEAAAQRYTALFEKKS